MLTKAFCSYKRHRVVVLQTYTRCEDLKKLTTKCRFSDLVVLSLSRFVSNLHTKVKPFKFLFWHWQSMNLFDLQSCLWYVGFKGSGKVSAKSGLGSGGEIREGHRASTRQLVFASRASQNASLFGGLLWKGFTSAVSVTQAASLRRKFNPWVSSFGRFVGPFSSVSLLSTNSFYLDR